MGFPASISSAFLSLKNGLINVVLSLEDRLKNLLLSKVDICQVNTQTLQNSINLIIKELESVIKIIDSITKILDRILAFIEFIQILIIGILILTKVLKLLPIPTLYTTVGITTTFSDLLVQINTQLSKALLIVTGVNFVISYISLALSGLVDKINLIISQLSLVGVLMTNCSKGKKDLTSDDKARIVLAKNLTTTLTTLSNSLNILNDKLGSLIKSNNSYKGFVFQIIEEEIVDQNIKVKRRYAIAINTSGILILQGEPSYATDTQVLIDELKQIIDIKGLSGYPAGTNGDSIDTQKQVAKSLGLPDPTNLIQDALDAQKNIKNVILNSTELSKLQVKPK